MFGFRAAAPFLHLFLGGTRSPKQPVGVQGLSTLHQAGPSTGLDGSWEILAAEGLEFFLAATQIVGQLCFPLLMSADSLAPFTDEEHFGQDLS